MLKFGLFLSLTKQSMPLQFLHILSPLKHKADGNVPQNVILQNTDSTFLKSTYTVIVHSLHNYLVHCIQFHTIYMAVYVCNVLKKKIKESGGMTLFTETGPQKNKIT